ncbi:MAG: hypothetical protein HGA31_06340 [Candidatus Moranbacteria bacterium]|nr:hypothetical protein [Candidatus Moranbacteria bacterium]
MDRVGVGAATCFVVEFVVAAAIAPPFPTFDFTEGTVDADSEATADVALEASGPVAECIRK